MFCHRTIDAIGGKRLGPGSSLFNGMRLSATDQCRDRPDDSPETAVAIDVTIEGYRYMIVWGDKWTDDAIARARADVEAGQQPWMCQRCGNRVCRECGGLLAYMQGADVLKDDGSMPHHMVVPTSRICSNPACERYVGD